MTVEEICNMWNWLCEVIERDYGFDLEQMQADNPDDVDEVFEEYYGQQFVPDAVFDAVRNLRLDMVWNSSWRKDLT